jgi:hypothetical protein
MLCLGFIFPEIKAVIYWIFTKISLKKKKKSNIFGIRTLEIAIKVQKISIYI